MGRKRDKAFDGPSKRRTILQIEKSTLSTSHAGSPGHVGAGAKPKASHNPLGLLASYGDSDDEGADEEAPTPPRPTKGGFIGMDETKPANEMDVKVADFLAEIDALDPEEAAEEHSSEPSNGAPAPQDPAPVEPPPAAPVDNGGWQELLDENTNCIYYWNTITNDVTWEVPAGFQSIVPAEQPSPPPEPEEQIPAPSQPRESPPKMETEPVAAPPEPISEELKPELKKVLKEDLQIEVSKKTPSAAVAKVAAPKAPVVDMFADEVDKTNVAKKVAADNVMPVYGTLNVNYDIDEDEEEEEQEEEEIQEPSSSKKLGAYAMFVKGDTLPGSKDDEKKAAKKSTMQLSHYDVTCDDDLLDGRTNGDAGTEEDEEEEVIEMDVGDDIDIDQQLELALERKKAELAQLEDLEQGSTSPSNKRKMSSPLNVYDDKGEVNLLSFKKKRLENMKGQKHVQTCDQGTQCDEELEQVAADDKKSQSSKKVKEEASLKKELSELGSMITGKLEFLGQSRKGLTKLQTLLIEIETRILDWREGALDGKHLLRKLQIADWELQKNEAEAVPPGWTCTWNRTYKQYYYTNSTTGESQWDYPADALATEKEEDGWEQTLIQLENSAMFNRASSQDDSEAKARGSTSMMHGSVMSEQLLSVEAAPSPPAILFQAAPPPPPDNAPPLPSDPPPPGTGPDLPPLPPSPPPMPPSPPAPPDDSDEDDDESEGPSSRPFTPPPLPPSVPPSFVGQGPGGPAAIGGPPMPPEMDDGTVIGKPQVLYTNAPITAGATISRPPEPPSIDGMPIGDYGGAPVPYGGQTGSGEPSGVVQPTATKPKKTKKVKKSAVKKKMPLSLVEKWKSIQEQQIKEEEEKRRREEEEEMVIDPTLITQKRIEEWKKQQVEKGKVTHNPNFEMIRGDWRERLKRKGPK